MRTMDGVTLTPILGIGTFCTHTLVHSKQCIPYDPALPPEQMSLIGCGVMTGVGAALYSAGVKPGTSVAVFGCGGVGDSVIMGSRLAGATTIIGVDIDPRKLEWAREFGATHTVNPNEGDPVEAIKAITGGYGVNYSFEAVGRPDTTLQAIFCRDLAGTCVIIGVAGPQVHAGRAAARQVLRPRRQSPRLLVRRLPADARFPAAGRVVPPGPPRSRPGRDPRHLARRGGRSVPRHGAGRDAAIGDSDLTGSGAVVSATTPLDGLGHRQGNLLGCPRHPLPAPRVLGRFAASRRWSGEDG